MNAQNFIRPSSSGAFGGGASRQVREGRIQTPFPAPQSMDPTGAAPRTGATTFPPTTERTVTEPLPTQGAASQFSGAEQDAAATARETAGGEATGPRYLLGGPAEAYNFRLGPIFFRLGASGGFEYNDNIDNSSDDRRSDLITTAGIFLNGSWALTKINDLNLNLGFGYTSYLAHPELNSTSQTLELSPDTEIAFKMKIGEVFLNFYERPSLGQDTSNELTLPSGFLYSSFQNDAGVTAFLDLNDVTVQATYNRSDTIPLTSDANSVNRSDDSSEQREADEELLNSLGRSVDSLAMSVAFRFRDDTSVGVEAGASRITYREGDQNDGFSYSAGVFWGQQLTQYITLRMAAGFQFSDFDSGGSGIDSDETNNDSGDSSPYFNVGLRHRVNRYLSHEFAMGYETDLGTGTDTIQRTYISEQITYAVSKDLALSLNASYEIGDESGGSDSQSFHLFRAGLSFGYVLTKKLTMRAFYEFVSRNGDSDTEDLDFDGDLVSATGSDYYQNRIGISFSYAF